MINSDSGVLGCEAAVEVYLSAFVNLFLGKWPWKDIKRDDSKQGVIIGSIKTEIQSSLILTVELFSFVEEISRILFLH